MAVTKKRQREVVIDLDSYETKEVIDVDSYVIRDIIDLDLYDTPAWVNTQHGNHNRDEINLYPRAKKPNIVRTERGLAALDECLAYYVKDSYRVLETGDEIYDAMLTQANVEDDINNFFVIQILSDNHADSYMVHKRWGRVGTRGKVRLLGPYLSANSAIQEFEQIFHRKTKNQWSNRKNFVSVPKHYNWLEMDYSEEDQGQLLSSAGNRRHKRTLDPRVASFIALIFSLKMPTTQQMADIGDDAEKLPLKNLSKPTIMKGYDILKLIAEIMGPVNMNFINDGSRNRVLIPANRNLFEQLSGEFYSMIPHDFGSRKMSDFVIDTPQKLRSKLEMIETLGVKHAAALLANGVGVQEDPLYRHYEQLGCEFTPVETQSEEFSMIKKYVENSQRDLSYSPVDIVRIFSVSRKGEHERFKKYAGVKKRKLLWHGSPLSNWTNILSQGLRVGVAGGIYFADMFALSSFFCRLSPGSHGVLALNEVALGTINKRSVYNYGLQRHVNYSGARCCSQKFVGQFKPDKSGSVVLQDGVIVPLRRPVEKRSTNAMTMVLPYNEYIVQNPDQVRMRYIVQVVQVTVKYNGMPG